MTGSASDHSLLRARNAHSSHAHSHQRLRHQHPSHADHDSHEATPDHDAGGDDDNGDHGIVVQSQPQRRDPQAVDSNPPQLNPDNLVTQVIQTVSLIQYVDPAGSAYETQTFYAPPNTVVIDTVSGNTINIPPPADSLTAVGAEPSVPPAPPAAPSPAEPVTSAAPPPAPEPQPQPPPSSVPLPPDSALPPAESVIPSEPAPLPASESVTESPEVTSAPLPPPTSTYPILTGSRNSTNTLSGVLSSLSIPLNNSTISAQAASGATSSRTLSSEDETASSQTRRKSRTRSTSISETIFSTTSDFPSYTGTATVTDGGFGGGVAGTGGIDGDAEPTATSPPGSDSPSTGGLSPKDKQVIGGVVGGVAGIAVFAMLLLLLLRHKRRRDGQPLFGSGPAPGTRAMITGGPDQGPSDPPMSERSGPFGVSAALASLNRKAPAPQSASGERGFYRVSGKKLPSVLHAGGDGYTDPRESVASGNSDYFRGSQEFEPSAAGGGRLALGSPMRPVSGVPVMRSGPARVAVAVNDENPFADPPAPPEPIGRNLAPHDPVGRSLVSQDGSRGSGSRFLERI